MSGANADRGEVQVFLGGKSYPMRPTYAAMKAIETVHGPIVALTTRLAHPLKRLTIAEMASIVTECIKAAGKEQNNKMLQAMQAERVAELIYDEGVLTVIDSIELLLINMITGGAKKKDETKTEAPTSTTGS